MVTDAQAYLVCSCYSHMELSKGIHIIILKYTKKINSEKKWYQEKKCPCCLGYHKQGVKAKIKSLWGPIER